MDNHTRNINKYLEFNYKKSSNPIANGCHYALNILSSNRIRSKLILIIGKSFNIDLIEASASFECLVMSAKVIDDLPLMDNSTVRGDNKSLHEKFGVQTATLISYALISESFSNINLCFSSILKSKKIINDHLRFNLTIKYLAECFGSEKATLGQYMDITSKRELMEIEMIIKTIDKKTASLYESAILIGWILGGGDLNKVNEVKETGKHLGRIMQMQDDLCDINQDSERNRYANIGLCYGIEKAIEVISNEILDYTRCVNDFKINNKSKEELLNLVQPVSAYIKKAGIAKDCG